jgi:dihydroflavonol-4-reductase
MKALVTGATGFIGSNVAAELVKQGYQVRALVRKTSDQRNIQSLNTEVAYGDLLDRASLEQALEDCDVLFHIAASYTFWAPHPEIIYQTNRPGPGHQEGRLYQHRSHYRHPKR